MGAAVVNMKFENYIAMKNSPKEHPVNVHSLAFPERLTGIFHATLIIGGRVLWFHPPRSHDVTFTTETRRRSIPVEERLRV
jgi:hypothetical protein